MTEPCSFKIPAPQELSTNLPAVFIAMKSDFKVDLWRAQHFFLYYYYPECSQEAPLLTSMFSLSHSRDFFPSMLKGATFSILKHNNNKNGTLILYLCELLPSLPFLPPDVSNGGVQTHRPLPSPSTPLCALLPLVRYSLSPHYWYCFVKVTIPLHVPYPVAFSRVLI